MLQVSPFSEVPPPVRPFARVAMRHVAEFMCAACAGLGRELGGDPDLGVIYAVLLRQADLMPAAIAGDAPDTGRSLSMNAVSRSVVRPFETVRRYCGQLGERGLIERTGQGVRVPAATLAQPAPAAIRAMLNDHLVRLIEDFAALEIPLPRGPAQEALDSETVERGALDLVLFTLEFGMPPHPRRSWTSALVFIAVMAANARGFGYDKALAHRYSAANTPPPDDIRRPISAAALARGLGLPYATVRRHLEAMLGAELVRRPEGYLVPLEWLQRPDVLESGSRIAQQLERVLHRLAVKGFPFDAPARAYRQGRPPLLPFE